MSFPVLESEPEASYQVASPAVGATERPLSSRTAGLAATAQAIARDALRLSFALCVGSLLVPLWRPEMATTALGVLTPWGAVVALVVTSVTAAAGVHGARHWGQGEPSGRQA